jgi:hypothetical protein
MIDHGFTLVFMPSFGVWVLVGVEHDAAKAFSLFVVRFMT